MPSSASGWPGCPIPIAAHRQAGYRYDVSILQAEFSLTQVLDRPRRGRVFFELVIRENLDLGPPRPGQLHLRPSARTPGASTSPLGASCTRVITEGVTPSLHVYYRSSKIKQYHKEGAALRTETTINDAKGDFRICKRLQQPGRIGPGRLLRQLDVLLDVQRISQEPWAGEDTVVALAVFSPPANEPRACASATAGSMPSCPPCWPSASYRAASPTTTCANSSVTFSA